MAPRNARKHQQKAVDAILAGLKQHARGQVHMACGTGKTLVGAWVADALPAEHVVLFVPALALVYQSWQEIASVSPHRRVLAVCSEMMQTPEGSVLDTTEERAEVDKFIARGGPFTIICTYQSAPVLESLSFDLGLFDEAHKTAGAEDKFFGYALRDENISIKKRVFLTATPRHVEPQRDTLVHSMDDEASYGHVLHRFSFREAVAAGVICDYQIVVSVHQRRDIPVESLAACQVAVGKTMQRFNLKKALTYHRTIAAAAAFTGTNPTAFPKGTSLYHVNNEQTSVNRTLAMRMFEDSSRAVMSNARCLIEGVDIPAVDLVAFIEPKRSYVDLVQAIGRAVRRHKDSSKRFGYVLLPLFIDEKAGESMEAAIERAAFESAFDVLRLLQEQDDIMANKLLNLALHHEETWLFDRLSNIEIDVEPGLTRFSIEDLKKAISVRLVNKLVSSRMKSQAVLLQMAKDKRPRPSSMSKDDEERYHGNALVDYTNKNSGRFDAQFNAAIRKAAPAWFLSSSALAKQELLERAKKGEPPPRIRGGKEEKRLADNLYGYLRPRSKTYDAVFAEELKKVAPDTWLSGKKHLTSMKDKLLAYAAHNTKKPTMNASNGMRLLCRAFRRVAFPGSTAYDAEVAKKLKQLRPHWF